MWMSTDSCEIDTERGEFLYDVSEDNQLEARAKYFANIEIKYKTAWGLKHS